MPDHVGSLVSFRDDGRDEPCDEHDILVEDMPDKIPVQKPAKTPKKRDRKTKQHGDLKLTVTFSDDKKEYQRQWSICRKHGFVPYPEAVKLEAAKKNSPKVEKEVPSRL
jgi:hypothetical protein